jgi:predicted nucleic acid-binding protein
LIVVDASALVGLMLDDPATLTSFGQLPVSAQYAPFGAPELVEPETLQALRRLERHEVVPSWRAAQAVAELGGLRRVLYPHGPFVERAWELRHELTAYDAMYVAVAERIDALLFTADRGLARVAKRLLGADRVAVVMD